MQGSGNQEKNSPVFACHLRDPMSLQKNASGVPQTKHLKMILLFQMYSTVQCVNCYFLRLCKFIAFSCQRNLITCLHGVTQLEMVCFPSMEYTTRP